MIVGGAVLAGGASSRMGRDKAFIEVGGRTLLDGAVTALQGASASPVVVIGGDREQVLAAGHAFVPDEYPGEGPLGGILTALRTLETDLVVVLACDLLHASSLTVTSMVGALAEGDAAVPIVDGRPQWLHAVWHRRSRSVLERAFAAGERAPRRAAAGLSVVEILDGYPSWYADADVPADLPTEP